MALWAKPSARPALRTPVLFTSPLRRGSGALRNPSFDRLMPLLVKPSARPALGKLILLTSPLRRRSGALIQDTG